MAVPVQLKMGGFYLIQLTVNTGQMTLGPDWGVVQMLATADQERCVAQADTQTVWVSTKSQGGQGTPTGCTDSRFKALLTSRRVDLDSNLTPEAALACASLQVQPPEGWVGPQADPTCTRPLRSETQRKPCSLSQLDLRLVFPDICSSFCFSLKLKLPE